ncbi:MAG: glycoside hydrolase domain-containing protein [Spirochaetota bacterium]
MKARVQFNMYNLHIAIGIFLTAALFAVDENVLFYIPFNGSAKAIAAQGNPDAIEGAISEYIDGKKGKAAVVNGSSWLRFNAAGNISVKQGTVTFWMKMIDWDAADGFYHYFFEAAGTAGKEEGRLLLYKYYNARSLMALAGKSSSKDKFVVAPADFSSWKRGEWHFVTLVWRDDTIELYLDGEQKSSAAMKSSIRPESFATILIGGDLSFAKGGEEAKTAIDELTIYGRALSPAEIKSMFKQAAGITTEGYKTPKIAVIRCAAPPVIDGAFSEDEWKNTSGISGFLRSTDGEPATEQTKVYITFDNNNIYCCFRSLVDVPLVALVQERDGPVWEDDAVEVFLCPGKNASAYYQFIGNVKDTIFDGRGKDKSWNGAWKYRCGVSNNVWTAELSMPFSALGMPTPKDGEVWGANFCRDWKKSTPVVWTSWSHAKNFHNPAEFGELTFLNDAPSVRFNSFGNLRAGELRFTGSIAGRAEKPGTVQFSCQFESKNKIIDKDVRELAVKPGERIMLTKEQEIRDQKTDFITFEVRDGVNGGMLCYSRIPVTISPPVMITAYDYADELKTLKVSLDTIGLPSGFRDGAKVSAVLADASGVIIAEKTSAVAAHVIKMGLPINDLAPGDYQLSAAVIDKNGEKISGTTKMLHKPDESIWLGNTIGCSEKVPSPWTPIVVEGNSVKCIGREYRLSGFGLPASIVTRGAEVLASPVMLSVVKDGAEIALKSTAGSFIGKKDIEAVYESTDASGELKLHSRVVVEYDGMMRVDVTLTPAKPLRLDRLSLSIVVKEPFAKYLILAQGFGGKSYYGGFQETNFKFRPFVWFGDDERGLTWFCESAKDWKLKNKSRGIEIFRKDGNAALTVNMIDAGAEISKPVTYTFGLMATPMRPMPSDWRQWRISPGKNETIKIVWPSGIQKWYGYMPAVRDEDVFKKSLKQYHEKGVRAVPYTILNMLSSGVPEYKYFVGANCWNPQHYDAASSDVMAIGDVVMGMCVNTRSWRDFVMHSYKQTLDKFDIDGVYYDIGWVEPCTNIAHGCGFIDDDDTIQPTFPVFAHRELAKRMYTLTRERCRNPFIIFHMSGCIEPPIHSFSDAVLDGEQFALSVKDDYTEFLPLDMMRAQFTMRQFGLVPVFLPGRDLHFSGNDKTEAPTVGMLARLYLHDMHVWAIWCNGQAVEKYRAVKDAFGMDATVEFIPYWSNGNVFMTKSVDIKISAWVKKSGSCLLAVANLGSNNTDATVIVDLEKIGFARATGLIDGVTGERFKPNGSSFSVPMKKKWLRLMRVEMGNH